SRFTLSTSCLPLPSFLLILPRQLISTLFPYTTLFRSVRPVFKRRTGWKISGRTALELISGGKENEYYRNRRSRFHRFQLYFSHVDRKSTRLNSSHVSISYAVFCLKKKKTHNAKSSSIP